MIGNPVVRKRYLDVDPDYLDGPDVVGKRRCVDEELAPPPARAKAWLRRLDAALERKQCEALRVQEVAYACRQAVQLVRVGAARLFYAATVQQGNAGWMPRSEAPHGQTGLHPAVAKLLGTTMTNTPSFLIRKSRRKISTEASQDFVLGSEISVYKEGAVEDVKSVIALDDGVLVEMKDEASDSTKEAVFVSAKDDASNSRKDEALDSIKREASNSTNEKAFDSTKDDTLPKIPRYVPPMMPDPPTVCASSVRMERNRIKRRIIVGNISKWLPEEFRLDAASHKWMLYVRGPRDAPDVSDIISKVRYFLHPSYRPNDIVDVVHPFYLNRRGWGEFPVRVQLHFTLSGNRPIDVIHNLKLDRTHSGLQTLGSETVVDVWLKTLLASVKDELSEEGREEEEKSFASPKPVSIVFSDGEHLTLDHKALDEEVQCMPPKLEIKKELQVRVQDEKKTLSSTTKEVVFHSIPDHDYLGLGSFKTGCMSCADDLSGATPRGLSVDKNDVLKGTHKKVRCNGVLQREVSLDLPIRSECIPSGNSEETNKENNSKDRVAGAWGMNNGLSRAYVQCVDDKGNVLLVTLEKPNLSAKDAVRRDTAAFRSEKSLLFPMCGANDVVCGSASEDSILSFKVLTSCSSTGRSLLKKNVFSGDLKVPSERLLDPESSVNLSIPASEPVILGRSRTPTCKTDEISLEQNLRKDAGALLPRLETCTAATWALRRMPLVHARADPSSVFSRHHPFCAQNLATFAAWPVGRRLHAQNN